MRNFADIGVICKHSYRYMVKARGIDNKIDSLVAIPATKTRRTLIVANQGGRYTKHIYVGSQRIVSKVGDFASYGSDPRRIEYGGSEADGVSVGHKSKYIAQQEGCLYIRIISYI